jgi:hypothetical protein
MASRFQQQSLWRKLTYFGLIILLLSATLAVRKFPAYGVEGLADKLEIREQNQGDVELTDKALRLTLTGSRGLAVCGLWYAANEKQKKHEWNEVELLVRSLIKLQPHFVSPWLFQSWNLAYNVSVECDRVKDKYFYISRGIQLLAQGDRLNRDNCDMRHFVGFYTQNKMGTSDEQNTLRALYQLSCIDPQERRPERFRRMVNDRQVIDWERFEEFCRNHPHLVRRLRESKLRYKTPDDVIDFLASSQKIPCLYEERSSKDEDSDLATGPAVRPLDDRFPVLPPQQQFDPNELTYDNYRDLGDNFDNYVGARAWFGYAQDPIVSGKRHPRFMSQIIFESQPPRAQGFYAENLEKEGWFDRDGWEIKDWFPKDRARPEGAKRSVVVGDTSNWGADAWDKTYQMWRDFGERHGLYKTPEEQRAMSDAERSLYDYQRMLTNFAHFYFQSDVERSKDVVTARKYFWRANKLRESGDRQLALDMYEKPAAFQTWKKILLANRDYRRDLDVQEDTYIMQRKYLSLLRDKRAPQIKRYLIVQDFLAQGAIGPAAVRLWVPIHLVPTLNVPFEGPFNITDDEGQPLLSEAAIGRAIGSLNLSKEPAGTFSTPPASSTPTPAPAKPAAQ